MSDVNRSADKKNRIWLRIALGLVVTIAVLFLCLWFGAIMMGVSPNQIESIGRLADSRWVLAIRWMLYLGLWFSWGHILRSSSPKITDVQIAVSRRPLFVLMLGYELFVASDLIGLISLLVEG